MNFNILNWLKVSLIGLLITALLGVLMRYKIGYELPALDQKNLQNAHSHIAFFGWISHALFVLQINFLNIKAVYFKHAKEWLITYTLFVYLLFAAQLFLGQHVFTFCLQGIFLLVFSAIAVCLYKRFSLIDSLSANWFKTAILASFVSFSGYIVLAIMQATHQLNQTYYLVLTYWFLHFQYNGWFLFSCIGFFITMLELKHAQLQLVKRAFVLMSVSLLLTFLLSVLWLKLSFNIYILAVLGAIVQTVGAYYIVRLFVANYKTLLQNFPAIFNYIGALILVAFGFKILLQLGSVIPEVSKLAFGFRSIVIAYLHLILLGIISLSLLLIVVFIAPAVINQSFIAGFFLFLIGVYLNEIILAIQGIASFSYSLIPYSPQLLLAASLFIFLSVLIMAFSFKLGHSK